MLTHEQKGTENVKDLVVGRKFFSEAAHRLCPVSLYESSLYVKDDKDKSTREILEQSANLGYRDAQWMLSKIHTREKDFEKGHRWLLIAASVGNDADAQFEVARNFHLGIGTKENYSKAFYFAKQSSDQGNAEATGLLGSYYRGGMLDYKSNTRYRMWIE
jgi:TPR repeat protein